MERGRKDLARRRGPAKNDLSHTETATGTIKSEQTKAPTETVPGETTYTAAFDESWATAQTKVIADIPATGSEWNAPEYEWSEDGSSCIATRTHKTEADRKETATATITQKVAKLRPARKKAKPPIRQPLAKAGQPHKARRWKTSRQRVINMKTVNAPSAVQSTAVFSLLLSPERTGHGRKALKTVFPLPQMRICSFPKSTGRRKRP